MLVRSHAVWLPRRPVESCVATTACPPASEKCLFVTLLLSSKRYGEEPVSPLFQGINFLVSRF